MYVHLKRMVISLSSLCIFIFQPKCRLTKIILIVTVSSVQSLIVHAAVAATERQGLLVMGLTPQEFEAVAGTSFCMYTSDRETWTVRIKTSDHEQLVKYLQDRAVKGTCMSGHYSRGSV